MYRKLQIITLLTMFMVFFLTSNIWYVEATEFMAPRAEDYYHDEISQVEIEEQRNEAIRMEKNLKNKKHELETDMQDIAKSNLTDTEEYEENDVQDVIEENDIIEQNDIIEEIKEEEEIIEEVKAEEEIMEEVIEEVKDEEEEVIEEIKNEEEVIEEMKAEEKKRH